MRLPTGQSCSPDFDILKAKLKSPVIFDGRNLYDQLLGLGLKHR